MKIKYEDASHYIDRQFGSVMYITTDATGIITGVDDGQEYKGKLEEKLKGLSIKEANGYLKKTFVGIFMYIKPM